MSISYDRRITLLSLATGLPAVAVAVALLWLGNYSWLVRGSIALLLVASWLGLVALLRERIVRPLQTVSNLLAALREDDFSIRARTVAASNERAEVSAMRAATVANVAAVPS